jgi:hypothetical protein
VCDPGIASRRVIAAVGFAAIHVGESDDGASPGRMQRDGVVTNRAATTTRHRLALAAVVASLVAACSAASAPSGSVATDPPLTSEPSGPVASASLELASPQPSKSSGGDERIYSGTLGSDAIEGGCVYLDTIDGRIEVLYPDGWLVRKAPVALVDPSGQVVAGAGDRVTIRGDEATDMVSICQIGPIVRAVEVMPG